MEIPSCSSTQACADQRLFPSCCANHHQARRCLQTFLRIAQNYICTLQTLARDTRSRINGVVAKHALYIFKHNSHTISWNARSFALLTSVTVFVHTTDHRCTHVWWLLSNYVLTVAKSFWKRCWAIVLSIRSDFLIKNSTLDRVGRVEDPIYKTTGQDISMTHILSATNLKLWGKLLDYFIWNSIWFWGKARTQSSGFLIGMDLRIHQRMPTSRRNTIDDQTRRPPINPLIWPRSRRSRIFGLLWNSNSILFTTYSFSQIEASREWVRSQPRQILRKVASPTKFWEPHH